MKVNVLKSFTGYPDGKKKYFPKGTTDISGDYIKEANLVKNGLVENIASSEDSETNPE